MSSLPSSSPSKRVLKRLLILLLLTAQSLILTNGCQFYPIGEYLRFVRVPENLKVGDAVMTVEVHNKYNLTLQSIDKGDDAKYFTFKEINPLMVQLSLARSLENIVDNDSPQNILKFRLVCYPDEPDMTPTFLSFHVYVEDINDHAPEFLHAPYFVTVEELTPVGLTVFRGISAVDLDKPNTANSDVHFSIIEGNDEGKFALESSHKPALVVKRNLDYDMGDHEFRLKIMASDRGRPSLSSTSVVVVKILDGDDLPPIFTKPVYRTQIKEFHPFTNKTIRQEIKFSPPILAYDQDLAINTSITYDIVSGNDMKYFEIDPEKGSLYLIKEIDREILKSNVFDLQIRARQTDNPTKLGLARIEALVIDINDHVPQFEVDVYNISIMENLPNGFSVLHVIAKDIDKGDNAEFSYKLEDRTRAFNIDPKTGWLTVRDQSQLDREKVASIKLKVIADEKVPNVAFGSSKSQAQVEVYLLDSNDNNPNFVPSNLYKFQVTIDSEIGSVVGQVTAEDPDLDGNGKIMYELQKSNTTQEDVPFEIDANTGYIFLLERPLPKLQYTLLVEAADQPLNPSERRYSLAVVQIDVVKAGAGHSPEFIGSPYEFWVGTHVGIGTSVGQVKVNHLDSKHTVYDLLHSYYEGVPFAIEERTGIIAVVDELIKYTRTTYDFEAYVTDSRHTLTTNLTIHVVDPLDTVTQSSQEPIELKVKENVAGAIVTNLKTLLAEPLRETRNMEFLLANFDARDKFAIASDGTVYTLRGLDREEKERHLLTVISQSRGVIQGQGVWSIYVTVEDSNDNIPKFERQSYEGHVRENSNPGTPVVMEYPVKVYDPDVGPNADFVVELKGEGAERFRVDPKNGKLFVGNTPLDREEKQMYSLKLIATDKKNPNMSSSVPLMISIIDQNDNAPVFIQNIILDPPELDQSNGPRELLRSSASHPVSVEISHTEPIRIPETIPVGQRVARVLASDRDMGDNSKVFYRIVSENSNPIGGTFAYLTDKQYLFSRNRSKDKHFTIDRNTGEISVAKPLKPDTEYALNISATDRGGLRSYTGVRVIVDDVNNHAPRFDQPWYTFELLEGNYLRGEIGKISAKDGDMGSNGEISYKLRPKENYKGKIPFQVDSKTGLVYVKGEVDREEVSRYSFQAVATDAGTPPMEAVVDVEVNVQDVNDNAPSFYGYMSTIKVGDSKITPVYRTTLKDNILPGTVVAQIHANDSDYTANGNGLVLFHLGNNHREFYIDSKNGTISTLTTLAYDLQNEYNVTVVASDLGKPSLSSSAWVLVRLTDSRKDGKVKERLFDEEIYTFEILPEFKVPLLVAKMNVSEKFRKHSTEFDLLGGEKITSNFRIASKTGEIFLMKKVHGKFDMIVRAFNPQHKKDFDTRQTSQISDRYLEHNEALIRVDVQKPDKDALKSSPPLVSTSSTQVPVSSAASPAIVTKLASPKFTYTSSTSSSSSTTISPTTVYTNSVNGKKSPHKNNSYYAGEIAVLTLSCVIFLGGLVAAISVACVKRKKRRRRMSHIPAIPVEVRLQKQQPSRKIGAPARPVIFPMALPNEPLHTESSDSTSETYTDSPEVPHPQRTSYVLKSGYSICPDCRKLRKPKRGTRDRGPMKQRGQTSLNSSNDSGIEGSEGQCTCCHINNNNSSSESGRGMMSNREQYEDSLMPPQLNPGKSFRRKRILQTPYPNQEYRSSHHSRSGAPTNYGRRSDRVVIL